MIYTVKFTPELAKHLLGGFIWVLDDWKVDYNQYDAKERDAEIESTITFGSAYHSAEVLDFLDACGVGYEEKEGEWEEDEDAD